MAGSTLAQQPGMSSNDSSAHDASFSSIPLFEMEIEVDFDIDEVEPELPSTRERSQHTSANVPEHF